MKRQPSGARRPMPPPGRFVFLLLAVALAVLPGCSYQPPRRAPGASTPGAPAETPITGPGGDWKVYSSTAAPVQFSVPPEWSESSPGELAGPGGFARLEALPYDGQARDTVCQGEANRGRPERYGSAPQIIDNFGPGSAGEPSAGSQNAPTSTCLVLPSPDQPAARAGEAVYFFWLPAPPGSPDLLFALRADSRHIQAVVKSLILPAAPPAPEAACDFNTGGLDAHQFSFEQFTIYEFPVAQGAACDPYREPRSFSAATLTGDAALRTREVTITTWSELRLKTLNRALQPFGYRVETEDQLFKIFSGGQELHNNINWVGPLTVEAGGDDFILPLVDSYNGNAYVLRASGLQPFENWDVLVFDRVFPLYAGPDEITLSYDYEIYPRTPNNPALLNVYRAGSLVDRLSVSGAGAAGGAVRGAWAWNGQWVVELTGLFIENGRILNDELGYTEMFNGRLFGQKQFYFFRFGKSVNLSLDGQTLPVGYDQIIHEPLCCAQMLLTMKNYPGGMTFFARRGAAWYYVVIRALES